MVNDADLVGLDQEQTRRFMDFDRDVREMQEGIAAWHRLLDRRRLDRKLGLHPIAEFALSKKPNAEEPGSLVQKQLDNRQKGLQREPFYLGTEAETRGLLLRCVGYLTDAEGNRLAADKGYGGRDKMAEWIIREIRTTGALAYIGKHSPHVFGIPLKVASA
jgi:hypothetical protein